ncbi:MAG TPA: glycosyltransferase family 87 protein [Candidatus Dormibacteraeota bacterium]|nr:glycosyltransferase family 87 protein [Candidatus Dormibacteraeota bacterium]
MLPFRQGSWRWRGVVALTAVALGFVIYPLSEPGHDVINSDWPAFATGAKLAITDPGHLYDLDAQQRVQLEVTGGRQLVTPGIHGILPFLAPAYVALLAAPFATIGTELGGRLWILFGLACLALALWLVSRPRSLSAALPGFAGVPTALLLLNAQLDGIVALGLGAAVALWSRPFLAGLALGLTLMKPQLILPAGLALIVARRWRVLAGWAAAGVVLWASFAIFDPLWVVHWLAPVGNTVAPVSREVDLPHLGVLLPQAVQTYAVAAISLLTGVAAVLLAWRRRTDMPAAVAIVIAGGILAAPHALPADLVLVAFALVAWGRAAWHDWLILSIGAIIAAITPAPVPALVGLVVIGWVLARASGATWPSPRPQPQAASSR